MQTCTPGYTEDWRACAAAVAGRSTPTKYSVLTEVHTVCKNCNFFSIKETASVAFAAEKRLYCCTSQTQRIGPRFSAATHSLRFSFADCRYMGLMSELQYKLNHERQSLSPPAGEPAEPESKSASSQTRCCAMQKFTLSIETFE